MSLNSILIVDDEKNVASALKRELEDEGYIIHTATSAEDALARLETNPCKVIISDVKMSGMNGLELLRKVKGLYPEMIRIVLTGHGDTKLILDAVNRDGIDRYLTKPWEIEDIKFILQQVIELYDLRKEVQELRKKVY
jgi:DNA-binding NtrC family response regulator